MSEEGCSSIPISQNRKRDKCRNPETLLGEFHVDSGSTNHRETVSRYFNIMSFSETPPSILYHANTRTTYYTGYSRMRARSQVGTVVVGTYKYRHTRVRIKRDFPR